MTAAYEPLEISLGTLPEPHEGTKTFDLKKELPSDVQAKEVLVYTFVTTRSEGEFQRGYYEFYTTQGDKKYMQYMNVAAGQGVNAVNSANMWFPFGEGKLNIKLIQEEGKQSVVKTSGDGKEPSEFVGLFLTGYRV